MVREGNFEGALEVWKKETAKDGANPANWKGLAGVLDSMGEEQKAETAREHANRLETQAIAEATGRKMEDIIADLLDDGVLNFSAGSDAKTQGEQSEGEDPQDSGEDDLTQLPGIGPVGMQRLNFAGITTFEQLAQKNDEEIAEIIKARKVESWSSMARMLAEK